MKVAVIEGADIGGTCVNRGCVPSKALLAAAGRVRDFKNQQHLNQLGIQVHTTLLTAQPSYGSGRLTSVVRTPAPERRGNKPS